MKTTVLISLTLCLCMTANLLADTYYVDAQNGDDGWNGRAPVYDPGTGDGPKETIRGGVNEAIDGDTVIVADGLYIGPDNYGGDVIDKPITLRSANGPDNCIINTGGQYRPFEFNFSYYNGQFVMDGFTILNATDVVMLFDNNYDNPPEIKNCVIRDCTVQDAAVILENDAEATLTGCTIMNISAQNSYDIISNILTRQGATVTISDCYIEGPRQDSVPYSAGVRCEEGGTANINGSTITQSWGVGVIIDRATCSISDSVISDNWVGGIWCEDADEWSPSSLTVSDSEITGNWGMDNAALRVGQDVNAVVTDCNITENVILDGGSYNPPEYPSVVGNFLGALKLQRCNITDNWTDITSFPGQVINVVSPNSLQIIDCDIRYNDDMVAIYATGQYGNMGRVLISNTVVAYNAWGIMSSLPMLISNCTVVANGDDPYDPNPLGIRIFNSDTNSVEVLDSIVYGNYGNEQIHVQYPGSTLANYCDIEEFAMVTSYGGVGNFDADPNFADSYYDDYNDVVVLGDDFHLISIAGRYDPATEAWVNDANTSACVDAGDPNSDYSLEPDPSGTGVNIGAYGGTIYASRSPYGPRPYCSNYTPADFNMDCKVDFVDLAEMAASWLDCYLVPASACDE